MASKDFDIIFHRQLFQLALIWVMLTEQLTSGNPARQLIQYQHKQAQHPHHGVLYPPASAIDYGYPRHGVQSKKHSTSALVPGHYTPSGVVHPGFRATAVTRPKIKCKKHFVPFKSVRGAPSTAVLPSHHTNYGRHVPVQSLIVISTSPLPPHGSTSIPDLGMTSKVKPRCFRYGQYIPPGKPSSTGKHYATGSVGMIHQNFPPGVPQESPVQHVTGDPSRTAVIGTIPLRSSSLKSGKSQNVAYWPYSSVISQTSTKSQYPHFTGQVMPQQIPVTPQLQSTTEKPILHTTASVDVGRIAPGGVSTASSVSTYPHYQTFKSGQMPPHQIPYNSSKHSFVFLSSGTGYQPSSMGTTGHIPPILPASGIQSGPVYSSYPVKKLPPGFGGYIPSGVPVAYTTPSAPVYSTYPMRKLIYGFGWNIPSTVPPTPANVSLGRQLFKPKQISANVYGQFVPQYIPVNGGSTPLPHSVTHSSGLSKNKISHLNGGDAGQVPQKQFVSGQLVAKETSTHGTALHLPPTKYQDTRDTSARTSLQTNPLVIGGQVSTARPMLSLASGSFPVKSYPSYRWQTGKQFPDGVSMKSTSGQLPSLSYGYQYLPQSTGTSGVGQTYYSNDGRKTFSQFGIQT